MRLAPSVAAVFGALCCLQGASAGSSHLGGLTGRFIPHNKRSAEIIVDNQHRDVIVAPRHELQKRYTGHLTYYSTGLGACGHVNHDNDFIVALNHEQYDSGNWCGKGITISCRGKSTHATIVDRCAGCRFGSIDASPGLFKFFADLGAGVLECSWTDGASPPPPRPPPPPPPPKTTSKKETPPPRTSTTSKKATSTTQSTSSTVARASTTSASTSAASTSTSHSDPGPKGALFQFNTVLLQLSGLVVEAAGNAGNVTHTRP